MIVMLFYSKLKDANDMTSKHVEESLECDNLLHKKVGGYHDLAWRI